MMGRINGGNQVVSGPHPFGLVSSILQNILLCVQQNKENHTDLEQLV